jgi:hypothetical protein
MAGKITGKFSGIAAQQVRIAGKHPYSLFGQRSATTKAAACEIG